MILPQPLDLARAMPLKYVGHVNIVGDCFCFGLAVEYVPETYRAYPIYLNLCGAATSVEAACIGLRAWLAKPCTADALAIGVRMVSPTLTIPTHPAIR